MSPFANIWAAPLSLLALVMAGLYVYYKRRDDAARRAYADTGLLKGAGLGNRSATRYIAPSLLVAAILLGSIAAARPIGPPDKEESGTAMMDVIVALDVSDSMAVGDEMPNRLSYAKDAIANLVTAAPGNRYGLVVFSGEATVSCPVTSDHDAFLTFLDGVGFSKSGLPGTAIGEAVLTAAMRFKPGGLPRAVLVVTDGENTYGADPVEAAKSARARNMKVYTLGVGTPSGGKIPMGRDFFGGVMYKTDRQGRVVNSRLDRSTLEKVADAGGGKSFVASGSGAVGALAGTLSAKEAKEVKGIPADAKEYGPYFALAAFAALTVALAL